MSNKYDPLWKYAGVKHPLVGTEPDIDARCPVCHVTVHLGVEAKAGQQVNCGLCGEPLQIVQEGSSLQVRPLAASDA